jgi:hypothetical protein
MKVGMILERKEVMPRIAPLSDSTFVMLRRLETVGADLVPSINEPAPLRGLKRKSVKYADHLGPSVTIDVEDFVL